VGAVEGEEAGRGDVAEGGEAVMTMMGQMMGH